MQRVPADNFNRQEMFALYRPITVHWCPTLAKIHGFYFYTLKHMRMYISIFTWEAMHRAAKSPKVTSRSYMYIALLHRTVTSRCYMYMYIETRYTKSNRE